MKQLYALFTETNESGATGFDPMSISSMDRFKYSHAGMNLLKPNEYIMIGTKNSVSMNLYNLIYISNSVLFKKPYTKIAKVIDMWTFDHNTESLISLFSEEYFNANGIEHLKAFDKDICKTFCGYVALSPLKPITEREVVDLCIDPTTNEPDIIKFANAICWAWLMADKSALNITVNSVYNYTIKTYPNLEYKIQKYSGKKIGKRWKSICEKYFTALTEHHPSTIKHVEEHFNDLLDKLDKKMKIYSAQLIVDTVNAEGYTTQYVSDHPIRPITE